MPGCDGAGMAERSYPASEVNGGREELPRVQGQGQRPRVPGCDGAGMAERSYPASKVRGGQEKPPRARAQGLQLGGATHARGQGRGPGGATPGAVATRVQEGLEELSHVEGQEQRR